MACNVLVICSDQHQRDIAGCYGHRVVQTPNIDRLAARGTTFTHAYAAAPICVSARASMQTGQWVHQLGMWSSAQPYDGSIPGWGHVLEAHARASVSVGKLHFRSTEDNNGFSREILPVHVPNGVGFTSMMVRDTNVSYGDTEDFAQSIGRGESPYTRYDRHVCKQACQWLREEAPQQTQPWTLFASFVAPHHPIIAPAKFYDRYSRASIDMPRLRGTAERPDHPVLQTLQNVWDYDRHFRDDDHIREVRLSYYALVSFLDHNIGKVLKALDESGQAEETLVIYLSDHGEMLGNHGLWAKMNMYEESAAIPLIISGPGIAAGARCEVPASHVDLQPTILRAHALEQPAATTALPGVALQELASGADTERAVLSEYHETGAVTGMFMLRWRNWKYIAYPGFRPQLFDLAADPAEATDLAANTAYATPLADCAQKLRGIVDPEEANRQCFTSQQQKISDLGGRAVALADGEHSYTPMPVLD